MVRELQTGLTLRSGWMSEQDQTAFENFLLPIRGLDLTIAAVISDKQRGLVPAVIGHTDWSKNDRSRSDRMVRCWNQVERRTQAATLIE